jgi:hypothetical protein
LLRGKLACVVSRLRTPLVEIASHLFGCWRRLDGHSQLPKLITGVKFIDGIEAVSQQPLAA